MNIEKSQKYVEYAKDRLIDMGNEGDSYAMAELCRRMVLKTARAEFTNGHTKGYRDGQLAS